MKKVPGVLQAPRFLSPAVCASLRMIYDQFHTLAVNKDYTLNPVLHLYDLHINGRRPEFEFMQRVVKRIYDGVRVLTKPAKPLYVEAAFLARLPEGGCHPLHRDNCKEDGSRNHTPQRDYSSITYLNGNFTGGQIVFPGRGEIKPKTGLLVGFPSGKDFPHLVPTVLTGKRYSTAVWFTHDPNYDMYRGRA